MHDAHIHKIFVFMLISRFRVCVDHLLDVNALKQFNILVYFFS